MKSGTLSVVGTGIAVGAQTTPEARFAIERADKVYYISADPIADYWIRELNASAESLNRFYESGKDRRKTYEEMVVCVLSAVVAGYDVCFVSYGHPGVFAHPTHEAIRRARAAGYTATMLPAVSADACLFADLGIDPGVTGYQSFEATDFLIYARTFDVRSALVLWQIGVIGEFAHRPGVNAWNPHGISVLAQTLLRHYPADHIVTVYEAARYACCKPTITPARLDALDAAPVSAISTLYVPPLPSGMPDLELLERLSEGALTKAYA